MAKTVESVTVNPVDARNIRFAATVAGEAAGVYNFAIGNSVAEFAQANSLSGTSEKTIELFLAIRREAWKASATHAAVEMTLKGVKIGCKLDRKTGTAIMRKTLSYEGGPADKATVKAAMDRAKATSERNLALWALAHSRAD